VFLSCAFRTINFLDLESFRKEWKGRSTEIRESGKYCKAVQANMQVIKIFNLANWPKTLIRFK
jgi:hypothetical protein